jgi:hypothetical protein
MPAGHRLRGISDDTLADAVERAMGEAKLSRTI